MPHNLTRSMRPPTRVFRLHVPHPSLCHGNPYSQDTREIVLQAIENDDLDSEAIRDLQQQRKFPHPRTVRRFRNRARQHGHCRAFRHTGNRHAEREIEGQDLILLALYRSFLPKASAAEVNAFLFNMNVHDPLYEIYSNSQITRAEQRICLTRKRSSTTAYQALGAHNILKRRLFWNANYPVGISDIDPRDMIDIDEAGWEVQTCNRTIGKSVEGERVREVGPYSKTENVTVLLGISGDPDNPDRWLWKWRECGTTVDKFYAYLEELLESIGRGTPERRRCFTMDNLTTHQNAHVKTLIFQWGHRIVFRAPYYPIDGPIEYVFNTLHCALQMRLRNIKDTDEMENHIANIVQSMNEFSCYFNHCGFAYE